MTIKQDETLQFQKLHLGWEAEYDVMSYTTCPEQCNNTWFQDLNTLNKYH